MAANKLDVIIFGATGFTGKYTVLEGVKILSKLTWGVAGRSQEKLEAVLKEMTEKSGTDLSKIPIVVADLDNEESLKQMAARCKVVVNCCGPYRFFGEQVIKACIAEGAHHVDVSGEPQFMERMQLEYHEKAKEKGVYIVSACGFDSIPADMGTIFLENHFDGQLNSVETYIKTTEKGPRNGASIHYGTWHSAVYGLAKMNELAAIREKLFTKIPKLTPKLNERACIHKSPVVPGAWTLPFPGSDRSVVKRSQLFMYENENKRPVQMRAYITFRSMAEVIGIMVVGFVFAMMTKFKCGCDMLLKWPRLFSLGFVSHEGPPEERMKNTYFSMYFNGLGWPKSEMLSEPTDQYTDPPTKTMIAKVTGVNPGYGATCVSLLLSATTILEEHQKMPGNGGVVPPGAAFAKTNLISNLCKNGFTFEIVSGSEETKPDE